MADSGIYLLINIFDTLFAPIYSRSSLPERLDARAPPAMRWPKASLKILFLMKIIFIYARMHIVIIRTPVLLLCVVSPLATSLPSLRVHTEGLSTVACRCTSLAPRLCIIGS